MGSSFIEGRVSRSSLCSRIWVKGLWSGETSVSARWPGLMEALRLTFLCSSSLQASQSVCKKHSLLCAFSKSTETIEGLWGPELQVKPASLSPCQQLRAARPAKTSKGGSGGRLAQDQVLPWWTERHFLQPLASPPLGRSPVLLEPELPPGSESARSNPDLLSFSHRMKRPHAILWGWGEETPERNFLLQNTQAVPGTDLRYFRCVNWFSPRPGVNLHITC